MEEEGKFPRDIKLRSAVPRSTKRCHGGRILSHVQAQCIEASRGINDRITLCMLSLCMYLDYKVFERQVQPMTWPQLMIICFSNSFACVPSIASYTPYYLAISISLLLKDLL